MHANGTAPKTRVAAAPFDPPFLRPYQFENMVHGRYLPKNFQNNDSLGYGQDMAKYG